MNVAGREVRVRWRRVGVAVAVSVWAVSLPWIGDMVQPTLKPGFQRPGVAADVLSGMAATVLSLFLLMVVALAGGLLLNAVKAYRDARPVFIEIKRGGDE